MSCSGTVYIFLCLIFSIVLSFSVNKYIRITVDHLFFKRHYSSYQPELGRKWMWIYWPRRLGDITTLYNRGALMSALYRRLEQDKSQSQLWLEYCSGIYIPSTRWNIYDADQAGALQNFSNSPKIKFKLSLLKWKKKTK